MHRVCHRKDVKRLFHFLCVVYINMLKIMTDHTEKNTIILKRSIMGGQAEKLPRRFNDSLSNGSVLYLSVTFKSTK